MIYLDHNATTPPYPTVLTSMQKAIGLFGNPSSVHKNGRKIRGMIEESRIVIAEFFKINAQNIIFTSGATEANNLALNQFKGQIILSDLEHESIYNACTDPIVCKVHSNGLIDLHDLEEKLKEVLPPVIVCVIAVHNETGVIQSIDDIVNLCQKYNARIHCDAVQAVGKIDLPWSKFDSFSISGHKIGGLTGIGALIVKNPNSIAPQIRGGGQERGIRSGTENFLGIIGMAEAIKSLNNYPNGFTKWRENIEEEIQTISPQAIIFGSSAPRVSNTSCIAMVGIKSEVQLMSFDLQNIAISNGAACSSGKIKISKSLTAMGFSEDIARCAIRISIGWSNQLEEIRAFIAAWKNIFLKTQ